FGEKNYSEAEIANIGSRNRGNRRRPSDCRLGGGTADCAAMEDQCLDRARLAAQARHQLSVAVSLTRLIKDDGASESARVNAYKNCLKKSQSSLIRNGTTNHGIYLADNSTKNLYLLKFLAETVAIGEDYYVKKILLNANQHQLHQLLCSSLSHGHSALATAILPSIQDVNKRLDDQLCSTTLMLAAELGHCHVIAKLLERGADRAVRDTQGCTALDRARLCGRNQATWVLAEEGNVELTSPASTGDIDLHDSQLSEKLHWALTSSGFTQSRAACQQRLADLLERTAACLSLSKPRLIGSFADGWGCSLTRLNARLSDGSGIDWLTPVTAAAGCPGATKLRLDFTGDPPDKEEGAQLLTVEDDASGSDIRSRRKQRMRQLNTVQGQLFILLKFLLKNYLAEVSQCPGLTSHHVKHLLFYLIETHGSWNWQMWQPHKLIELAKEALDLMMKFLDSTSSSDDGCMPSFFKPHVQLQLQWTGRPADEAKTRIRAELLKARSDLDPAVKKLMSHLKPLDDDDKLYFDLFTLLPLTLPPDVPHDRKSQAPDATELAGLYCSVAAALRALQAADEVDGEGALMRQLESWYECSWCHCAVRCLAVMAQLKYRNKTAAKETLSELVRDQVMSSGWTVEDLSKEAISETQSWRWPLSTDWAWRFCLPCDRRPSLPFLPRFTESLLTARLCSRSPVQRHLYLSCWAVGARACFRADDGAAGSGFAKRLAQQWFRELQAESAGSQLDTEELATLAHYTDSPVHLRFCLERMEAVVARGPRVAMDSCDNERLERVSRKRALRIVDQADCNNGDQLDDETMLKRHCDILDSLVDATKDILNYQATISEHHCQCVLMALLNITRHSVGNRCCQNAVVKYAATCDREEAQQRESNSATANGLDCSTALPPMPDAIRRELPNRREECYIRLADAAGSFAVSVQDSSAAESSWKVQGHCLKKLAKSSYQLQAACRCRAIEQAARDGRVEVLDRYMRKVPAMDRSFLCTCLIEELALSGKVDALRTLAMAMRETDSRNWCCFRMAANAALAGRLEASVLLLQSITFGDKLRKKCCKRLVLIAEEQHQLEELFWLLKNTSV
uniref:ANK_REP_REGION domain-containing protein n=1 Tax=Macrostomum lignano TaxID=282301 RepID=A0A1I8IUE2_9PLAT